MQLNPSFKKDMDFLMNYGSALEASKRFDDARKIYRKIIKNNDKLNDCCNEDIIENAYEKLENIEVKMKQWGKAIEICQAHLKWNKSNLTKSLLEEKIKSYSKKLNPKLSSLSSDQVLEKCLSTLDRSSISLAKQKWDLKIKSTLPDWAKKPLLEPQPPLSKFSSTWTDDNGILEEHLTEETKHSYKIWLESLQNKKPLKLNEDYAYLRYHLDQYARNSSSLHFSIYELDGNIALENEEDHNENSKKTREEFELLINLYINEPFPSITDFIPRMYLYVINQYLDDKRDNNAIAWWNSNAKFLFKHRYPTLLRNIILSLKYKNNYPLNGTDFLLLLDPSKSDYLAKKVKSNYLKVIDCLDKRINEFEAKHQVDLLKIITLKYAIKCKASEGFNYKSLGDFQLVVNEWIKEGIKKS